MAEGSEGKLRILHLGSILYWRTDEEHPLSTNQIIEILEKEHGIKAHRTTVTKDIEILREYGFDICKIESTQNKYFVGDRSFELPELQFLIDVVSISSTFTEKKSSILMKKLAYLGGVHSAESLMSGVEMDGSKKTNNEKIYYINDTLRKAIEDKKKVSFQYLTYDTNKELKPKNGGEAYIFSPHYIEYGGEFYYLIGYSHKHNRVSNFRLDRIADVPKIIDEERAPMPENFDPAEYIRSIHRMYQSDREDVHLVCHMSIINKVIDLFGKGIEINDLKNGYFETVVNVIVSPIFFRWVFGYEGKVKIKGPQYLKDRYLEMLKTGENAITD